MSVRHRKINATRRALREARRATYATRCSLARLAEKAAAIAREVDMISEELLPALRAYEERRGDA